MTVLRDRLKDYSLRVIRLYAALPRDTVPQVLGKQLLRSATSVGAHHREANRSRSVAEFVSKMEGALQELDESAYWLELRVDAKVMREPKLQPLIAETEQLLAMVVASVKTAKLKRHY